MGDVPPSDTLYDSMVYIMNSFKEEEEKETGEPRERINDQGGELCVCVVCGHAGHIVLEMGEYVCKMCNHINDRFIDTSAEWRFFVEDSRSGDMTRCGLPTNELLPRSSLGTMIGHTPGACHDMRFLRKYQMWTAMTYKERSLYNIFDVLSLNATNHGIPPSIIDEAKNLYKQISEAKLTRGDNRSGMIAASIYMACKRNQVPRSAKEISKIFQISPKVMTRSCKRFQEILKLELDSTIASDFIQRFGSRLNLSKEIRDICLSAVERAEEQGVISENTPPAIAAGCIYLVCTMLGVPVNKTAMTDVCGVSMVTVAKCYKKMYTYRNYMFDEDMINRFEQTGR
jgi:transcription initiation factor TFIIB